MEGKNLLCKLDFSQAYHCLQLTDQQSFELFVFNFASKTFAYWRLAEGLSCCLSVFPWVSFVNTSIHSSKPIKMHNMLMITAYLPKPSTIDENLRAVFQSFRKAGHKLSMAKCHFGVQEVVFLGRTITTNGVDLRKQKITKLLHKVKYPRSKKTLQH